jgi:hypothetical protein
VLVLPFVGAALAASLHWQNLGERGGITVWSREIPGKELIAFKAKTRVDANIAKVAHVLADVSRKKEWMPRLKEAAMLRETAPGDRVEYNHTLAPWPAHDRDFVFHALVDISPEKGLLTIHMRSVADPLKPPQEGVVRGDIVSTITLGVVGTGTEVTLEVEADPKGRIPAWIVNTFQRNWPRSMLRGLRKMATEPGAPEHPHVKEAFRL